MTTRQSGRQTHPAEPHGPEGIAPARWDSDPLTTPDGRPWDLLIVGGGTAGLVAAHTAAGFGASTLLVEQRRTGGDCLWTGCMPSKALLAAGRAAADARTAHRLGIRVDGVSVDFGAVLSHIRDAIAHVAPVDSPDTLRRTGARVAQGRVRFTGPATAEVDGTPVAFAQALLGTGSSPVVPGIPGLADADPLTSDSIWSITARPERLLVLGGGPVGCELGQGLARLGSRVTIVEGADRVLAQEHPDASRIVHDALVADGVDLRTGVALGSVEPDGEAWRAVLEDGSAVGFDRILVSVGRRPGTTGLGLDAAGVHLSDSGHVRVDARLRTSNRRIWAAGDLTGHPPFTHTAGIHGSLAASNAILGLRRAVQPDLVPRVTYTDPEVAAFGPASHEPGADEPGLTVRRIDHDEVDRAATEGDQAGFSQLVLDRKGRVVGATVVGPRAGESLAEAVLAGQAGLRARTLAGAMHAYPTWSDGVWKAGIAQGRAELEAPRVRRVTRALSAVRRGWMRAGTGATRSG